MQVESGQPAGPQCRPRRASRISLQVEQVEARSALPQFVHVVFVRMDITHITIPPIINIESTCSTCTDLEKWLLMAVLYCELKACNLHSTCSCGFNLHFFALNLRS